MKLVIHIVLLGIATAVGALLGQGHVQGFAGLMFRQGPMSLGAIVFASLTAWGLGVVFWTRLG